MSPELPEQEYYIKPLIAWVAYDKSTSCGGPVIQDGMPAFLKRRHAFIADAPGFSLVDGGPPYANTVTNAQYLNVNLRRFLVLIVSAQKPRLLPGPAAATRGQEQYLIVTSKSSIN